MKALTIKQPWASLIIYGGKDIENRTWRTNVRGRIAIHSSNKSDEKDFQKAAEVVSRIGSEQAQRFLSFGAFPTGVILGTVELTDCKCYDDTGSPWYWGPFGFFLRDPQPLVVPVPAKGKQWFWEWEEQ